MADEVNFVEIEENDILTHMIQYNFFQKTDKCNYLKYSGDAVLVIYIGGYAMNIGSMLRYFLWWMMNLASSLLIASLYFIKAQVSLFSVGISWLDMLLTIFVFLGIPLLLSLMFVLLSKAVSPKDSLRLPAQKVSSANKDYLPVYLSYFFVSLSIPGSVQEGIVYEVLIVFVFIIWIFTSLTTTYYFNPLLLLMGYKFYNVISNNGIELFIISRRVIRKNETNITFPKLKKLTELVYIEIL